MDIVMKPAALLSWTQSRSTRFIGGVQFSHTLLWPEMWYREGRSAILSSGRAADDWEADGCSPLVRVQ